MQHRMAGAIGRGTGSLRDALAEVRGHAAERPLVDLARFGARKRHPVMLEFDDGRRRLLAHEFDGILVAEPIRPFHGVVHMPAPIVRTHVTQSRGNAPLRRDGVTARRKHLGQTGGREPRLGQPEGGPQARAAGADDNHVIRVIDELIFAHGH